MNIGETYLEHYLKVPKLEGGTYIEYHDRPHFHLPLNRSASGHMILGHFKGNELMFYDSQIAQNVMLHHVKADAVVLPIHDSFVMHHAYGSSGELEETMRRSYYEVMGSDIDVSEQFIKEPVIILEEDPTNVQWDDISMDTLLKGQPDYSEYTKRERAWWNSRN